MCLENCWLSTLILMLPLFVVVVVVVYFYLAVRVGCMSSSLATGAQCRLLTSTLSTGQLICQTISSLLPWTGPSSYGAKRYLLGSSVGLAVWLENYIFKFFTKKHTHTCRTQQVPYIPLKISETMSMMLHGESHQLHTMHSALFFDIGVVCVSLAFKGRRCTLPYLHQLMEQAASAFGTSMRIPRFPNTSLKKREQRAPQKRTLIQQMNSNAHFLSLFFCFRHRLCVVWWAAAKR